MLGVFLFCGVAPVLLTSAAAYLGLVSELTTVTNERLIKDSKTASGLALTRLLSLAAQLGDTSAIRRSNGRGADSVAGSFDAVVVQRSEQSWTPIRGHEFNPPALDAAQRARLTRGSPLLIMGSASHREELILVASIGPRGSEYPRVWGHAKVREAFAGLELDGYTIRDSVAVILSPEGTPDAPRVLLPGQVSGSSRWKAPTGAMLSGYYRLFLGYSFGAPTWVVSLTEPEQVALAPIAWLRDIFLYGTIFAVILIFFLSHVQIRRQMTPLADLEAGTQRLRDGDFSSRVAITSNDEFATLGSAFNQMASDLQRQFTTLSAMHDIDHAALQDHTVGAIVSAALRGAPALLGADAVGVVAKACADSTAWRAEAAFGSSPSRQLPDVELSDADMAQLLTCSSYLVFEAGAERPAFCGIVGTGRVLVFPVPGQHGPAGALIVRRAVTDTVSDGVDATAVQIAEQLGLGLSNVTLLEELDSLSIGALTALARTIDASSPWTAGHSERVANYARQIAQVLGLPGDAIARLHQGSLLHDIGKIGVPTAVLDKAGPLSESELALMNAHPVIGARIVESVRSFRDFVPLVLHHHELLDGTGYPDRLSGDAIPELVRILTVADVFDALTSDRPYRAGLAIPAAMAILNEGAGRKFDRRAVDALGALVADQIDPHAAAAEPGAVMLRDRQTFIGTTATMRVA